MARRRKYAKKTFKRYKSITASRNYFKVKAEYYDVIQFPDNAGKPLFLNRTADQNANAATWSTNTIGKMMQGYTYSLTLSGLFSFYKIQGMAIEVIPKFNNADQVAQQTDVFLGYRVGNDDHMTLAEIKAVNQSLILDPRNRQRKYWKTLGNYGDWTNTSNAIGGGLSVESAVNGSRDTQHGWSIKVTMYLIYKFSKA